MAGGTQITISTDGITIKTAKVFQVHAGQHQFTIGEAVATRQTILPSHSDTAYSNQFNYSILQPTTAYKQFHAQYQSFVLDLSLGKLLAQTSADPTQAEMRCARFHSEQPTAVMSILCLSDQVLAQQDHPITPTEYTDPLLDDALNLHLNDEH